MMVYAAHVADDLAIEICLQNRLNLAKGQHDLQAGRQGFLVGAPCVCTFVQAPAEIRPRMQRGRIVGELAARENRIDERESS